MTRAQEAVWEGIQVHAKSNRCRCALEPAMTATELCAMGGGCTMPTFCCPTLDAYRRRTPRDLDT